MLREETMSKLNRFHAIALVAVMAVAIAVPFAIAQSKDASGQNAPRTEGRWHGMRGGDQMAGAFFRNLPPFGRRLASRANGPRCEGHSGRSRLLIVLSQKALLWLLP